MKLKIDEVYKILIPGEDDEEKEYEYYMCITKNDKYYSLNEIEEWATQNGQADTFDRIEDIDEHFKGAVELEPSYYKQINSMESVYYINDKIEVEVSTTPSKYKRI